MLASFLSGEFLLHIPCWLNFYLGSFSYTSHAGFIFLWGVLFTHPMLALFFCGKVFLHIPFWLLFLIICCLDLYRRSFYYTSHAGFVFLGSFSYTSLAGLIFIWGVSLTHPMLALFFCGEFYLHIPCWLYFLWEVCLIHPMLVSFCNLWSFSYTSRAVFIFIWGVSLTHPVLSWFLYKHFLLHIPSWFLFSFCFVLSG